MTDQLKPSLDIEHGVLARYVTGDVTAAERAMVESWMGSSEERRALLGSLSDVWHAADESSGLDGGGVDEAFRELRVRITATAPSQQEKSSRLSRKRWSAGAPSRSRSWTAMRMAASLLMVLGTGALYALFHGHSRGAEYATRAGELETITLSDGTRMMLAPESRVRVAEGYGERRRDLYLLEGQGYFTVTHDDRHPFVVHARNAVAQDVGTRFAVRSYPTDSSVQIVVSEGIVALRDTARRPTPHAILHGGMLAHVDSHGEVQVIAAIDTAQWLAWTDKQLVFDMTPLPEVARELSRWYGVDVELGDTALVRQHFTGSYKAESLAQVLSFITAATATRYEHRGHTITLILR